MREREERKEKQEEERRREEREERRRQERAAEVAAAERGRTLASLSAQLAATEQRFATRRSEYVERRNGRTDQAGCEIFNQAIQYLDSAVAAQLGQFRFTIGHEVGTTAEAVLAARLLAIETSATNSLTEGFRQLPAPAPVPAPAPPQPMLLAPAPAPPSLAPAQAGPWGQTPFYNIVNTAPPLQPTNLPWRPAVTQALPLNLQIPAQTRPNPPGTRQITAQGEVEMEDADDTDQPRR